MRKGILGFGGGRRRRRLLLGVLISVAALGVFAITNALAVHDEVFQLDGDVDSSTQTHVGLEGDPPVPKTQTVDWDQFFDGDGDELPLPSADFTASGFDRDFNTNTNGSFNTSDNSTFATGSKDTLAITPGWQCNQDNNVLSKNDIMNAYAASYENAAGDEILYFALERNANTGTANVGFWFLQDATVDCESTGGSTAFTGDHTNGDLLVVSEFTQGGVVNTIQVYQWVGGANGSLNPNPVASGVDCATTTGGDTACGNVNGGTITTPWPTANKQDGVGDDLRVSEFFEAGLNLTDSNLGGRCFNVFLADTRSSTSLTATLFDFSRGQLGQCTSTTTTTPKKGDGTTNITSEPIPATGTLAVKDSALVTVDGADTFSGEVKFYLCGPADLTSTGSCTSGGVQIGSAKAVTSSPSTVVSDAAQLTSAGRYCWRAEFSGDASAGVPGSKDDSTGECFSVTPLQPTLSTQATTGPVDFGNSITDVVTLAGTANQEGTDGVGPGGTIDATRGGGAGGTISVTVFGPDSCSTVAHGPITLNVNGNGNYGGVGSTLEFTPTAPGEYIFVASYSGDAPNTLGVAATACASQPAAEKVTVRQIPTEISTAQKVFPNDSATITSSVTGDNLPNNGTVIFRLYGPTNGGDPKTALQNCLAHGDSVGSGGLLYKETKTSVGGTHSVTVGTSNTSVAVDASATYYWRVTYATGDSAHTGRQSDCVENTVLTFNNDAGTGTLFP
jgi:hypothetical protein